MRGEPHICENDTPEGGGTVKRQNQLRGKVVGERGEQQRGVDEAREAEEEDLEVGPQRLPHLLQTLLRGVQERTPQVEPKADFIHHWAALEETQVAIQAQIAQTQAAEACRPRLRQGLVQAAEQTRRPSPRRPLEHPASIEQAALECHGVEGRGDARAEVGGGWQDDAQELRAAQPFQLSEQQMRDCAINILLYLMIKKNKAKTAYINHLLNDSPSKAASPFAKGPRF